MNGQRKKINRIVVITIWALIATFLFINRRSITPEKIASIFPEASFLSAVGILVLFAVKSLTVVVYAGILYATTALIFPMGWALAINFMGTALAASIPYMAGRTRGQNAIAEINEKYPKIRNNPLLAGEHPFMLTLILRLAKILPYDVVSLYLGAKKIKYPMYLSVSVLSMTDNIILFTMMGISFLSSNGRLAIITAVIEVVIIGLSMLWVLYYTKKKTSGSVDDEGKQRD